LKLDQAELSDVKGRLSGWLLAASLEQPTQAMANSQLSVKAKVMESLRQEVVQLEM
jgi:hypothetical protein